VLGVLYPDEGLLSSKPKRWACGSGYQIITPEEQKPIDLKYAW